VEKMWQPDLYIEDLIVFEILEVLEPLRDLYVTEIGDVWHKVTAKLTVSCSMDFDKFPMDTQSCPFKVSFFKINTV
jgi:hypothetical protein